MAFLLDQSERTFGNRSVNSELLLVDYNRKSFSFLGLAMSIDVLFYLAHIKITHVHVMLRPFGAPNENLPYIGNCWFCKLFCCGKAICFRCPDVE